MVRPNWAGVDIHYKKYECEPLAQRVIGWKGEYPFIHGQRAYLFMQEGIIRACGMEHEGSTLYAESKFR